MTAEQGAVQSTRKMVKALAATASNNADSLTVREDASLAMNGELAREGVSAFLEKRWPSWAPDELK